MESDAIAEFGHNLDDALDRRDLHAAASAIRETPTQVLAVLLARLDLRAATVAFRLIDKNRAIEVFELLDVPLQSEIVSKLGDDDVAQIFADLDPDDRVALLDELPAKVARRLMSGLSGGELATTKFILGYPDDSVGRRMTTRMVTLRPELSIGAAMSRVRDAVDVAETVYLLPVMDETRRLVGVVHLRDLLDPTLTETTPVSEIMTDTVSVRAAGDDEHAARLFADTGAIAIPVVDDEDRLVGIVTVDDALRILKEEDDEDAARQGASEPLRAAYLTVPVRRVFKARVIWLSILAVSALLTVQVLDAFEDELTQVVTLALFIPLLIGIGGNTGNQAATTVTRALALGDVVVHDLRRVVLRELAVGFCLGLFLGTAGFILAWLAFDADIATVIGLSILAICSLAASVGGLMPIVGKSLRIDPAVFSNPFITTFIDATGLLVYFLIAKTVLGI